MKHAPIVALALAAALIAGCGGGGSSTSTGDRVSELEDDLAAAQQAAREAEVARLEAVRLAAAQRRAAEAAEQQRQQEQARAEEAEREARELEEEARSTHDQLVQANARQVLAGLFTEVGTADPTVTPRYQESALVTTAPSVTFSSIETGTRGNWFRTSFSHRGGTNYDQLDVYTDIESPDSVPFKDSTYNTGGTIVGLYGRTDNDPETTDFDESAPGMVVDDNQVVGSVQISKTGTPENWDDAAASAFPRSGDSRKDFDPIDRGEFTPAERETRNADNNPDNDVTSGQVRNVDRYPLRYTYETSGRLGGASGTFTCASGAMETDCRVTNQNNHFRFLGPWLFTPLSATSSVRVDDFEFMYFGWWAQQANSDGSWKFGTFHGPMGTDEDGNRVHADEMSRVDGAATYVGPAVGQFSFYQPLTAQSEYGEFTATATLTANFDDDELHGTIDQFDVHEDWTLTLKHGEISTSGAATAGNNGMVPDNLGGVSWQIDGEAVAAPDSGAWEAAFYSNLPDSQRDTSIPQDEDAVPTGIAGTFQAAYHNVGRIIGAFGAHKQ